MILVLSECVCFRCSNLRPNFTNIDLKFGVPNLLHQPYGNPTVVQLLLAFLLLFLLCVFPLEIVFCVFPLKFSLHFPSIASEHYHLSLSLREPVAFLFFGHLYLLRPSSATDQDGLCRFRSLPVVPTVLATPVACTTWPLLFFLFHHSLVSLHCLSFRLTFVFPTP